jgi:hypothetical protein
VTWSRRKLLGMAGFLPAIGKAVAPPCLTADALTEAIDWSKATNISLVPNQETARVRISSSTFLSALHDKDRENLVIAYQKLLEGSPSLMDLQGRIHAAYCRPAEPPPGFSQNIHNTVYFLLWHRGAVYFHERMLQRYAPSGSLMALPYWDWSSASRMELYEPSPKPHLARPVGCFAPPLQFNGFPENLTADARSNALKAVKWPDYAGFQDGMVQPHESGHAMAGRLMPSFDFAAWDPMFYGHHGNCDRYFASWQKRHNPSKTLRVKLNDGHYSAGIDLDKDETRLYFYNEEGALVTLRAADLWDTKNLGYEYDVLEDPAQTHRFLSEGKPVEIGKPLDEEFRQALSNGRGILMDLNTPNDPPPGISARLAFLLTNKEETLPTDSKKLFADPRILGQISSLPRPEHHKAHQPRSAVDATTALRHFVDSKGKQAWIATVDIDEKGKVSPQVIQPKRTKLQTSYFSIEPRQR